MKKLFSNKLFLGFLCHLFMVIHILFCFKYKISFLDMGFMVLSLTISHDLYNCLMDIVSKEKRGE